ncbi:MAG: LURP-one-related family protein [Clostridia bacterium]|nr:LURP-one-related family protein [Clostridia bacterium]
MGVQSKYHRYRDAGQGANVNNVQRFGEPVRSLFTTTKVFSLHRRISITDENEKVVYQASTKFPSLHDKTDIFDAGGQHVSHIERKLFTLHERHFITMEDGLSFQLSNELWHLVRDITNIEGLGWQLQGNIAGLNFELYDERGQVIAVIGQKMFSIHDKYCVDIYQPEAEPIVVTILITLQHMIKDRESRSSVSFSSSGGSSGGSN